MQAKELVKILQKNGWKKISQNGSHLKLKKNEIIEIVPIHNKDIPKGTLNAILKRTGLK